MRTHCARSSSRRSAMRVALGAVVAALLLVAMPATAAAQDDPRVGLGAGLFDAETASKNLKLLGHVDKPDGFFDPEAPGSIALANSDLALRDDLAFVGNFNGFNVYDISDPANAALRTSVVCPGGQGDPSIYGDLLFISVEETRARVDCGTEGATPETRFRGVRIFDVSDLDNPVQVAAVQTCRGSHTHTLVPGPEGSDVLYVYVSGTAGVRPASELAGCSNDGPESENPSRWRIEVIEVPLDAPEDAEVANEPRLFTDPESGAIDGLQNEPPTPNHPSGAPWGPTPITDACHDITAYPEIGLAAGACEGNGILIDISDPANPVRVDEVSDPNFAYWHSATFSNDGSKVVFTDEWGGGVGPRCRDIDEPSWGANAIFEIVDGEMEFASYFKLPAPQTVQENCVAHNGSLVPVPGRDIMTQAWYQGGASVWDFTDPANPEEIGFFDRGPIDAEAFVLGGLWSTYWYNGKIYGTEIARGFDSFKLTKGKQISKSEIKAASEVELDQFNAQLQPRIEWAPSFAVVRALLDQLVRSGEISKRKGAQIERKLKLAEKFAKRKLLRKVAVVQLKIAARKLNGSPEQRELAEAILELADSLR